MPVSTYVHIALYVLAAAGMTAASAHLVHMLQLESYKNESLGRWIKSNGGHIFRIPILVSAAGFILALIFNVILPVQSVMRVIISVALSLVYIGAMLGYAKKSRVKNAKKPLVMTNRVKRLFTAIALVYVVICGVLCVLDILVLGGTVLAGLPLFLLMLLITAGILAANVLASPIEKAVQRWYINDAKRILAGREDLIRIGITGSYGKTSCKFILGTILSEKYDVLVPPASYNTPMGLTRVIREQLKNAHEVFIAEMGARHVGDIRELCDIVHPKFGLLTSVGPQHLETFGSIENIANTKYELIDSLPSDGCAFFPADNVICRELYGKTKIEKYLFAVDYDGPAEARAKNIRCGSFGSRFDLVIGEERIPCETRLLGKHNIANIIGCACVAHRLGLTSAQIRLGIRKIQPVEHRLQLLPTTGGVAVIDDAFNANPSGVRAAMEVLAAFEGRKIVVTPGMVELGEKEAEENHVFGKVMAGVADTVLLVGPKHTKPIYDGLKEAGFNMDAVQVFKSLNDASEVLWKLAKPGDVVIFENDLPDNYNE
jgi:UDP-N-acetylmuramoyl-tripeptide--D-alanyl-D-alanine ligase